MIVGLVGVVQVVVEAVVVGAKESLAKTHTYTTYTCPALSLPSGSATGAPIKYIPPLSSQLISPALAIEDPVLMYNKRFIIRQSLYHSFCSLKQGLGLGDYTTFSTKFRTSIIDFHLDPLYVL